MSREILKDCEKLIRDSQEKYPMIDHIIIPSKNSFDFMTVGVSTLSGIPVYFNENAGIKKGRCLAKMSDGSYKVFKI